MKVRLQEAHTPRAGTASGAVMDSPQSQLTDTPPGSPTPSQDTALSRGAAPPPPQLPRLHPQQVRGAQGAPGWGGCAPCPHPRNFQNPSPPSLDDLTYRDRCGRLCCKDRGEGVGEQVIQMVLHSKH